MEDHFDVAYELKPSSSSAAKTDQLEEVRRLSSRIKVAAVRQGNHSASATPSWWQDHLVGDEPFAVVLTDDVIDAARPALRQMMDVFERVDGPVIAVERVPVEDVSSYGIVATDDTDLGPGVHRIVDLVEKPKREDAPSNLAIIVRYILTPDIFPALQETATRSHWEIQLTNGMRRLLEKRPLYACEITGVRHDTGNKLGFLKATAYFALKHPEFADAFRRYLDHAGQADGTTTR
jgi:UTP--glucose-1-phosphate uridylyltransferase